MRALPFFASFASFAGPAQLPRVELRFAANLRATPYARVRKRVGSASRPPSRFTPGDRTDVREKLPIRSSLFSLMATLPLAHHGRPRLFDEKRRATEAAVVGSLTAAVHLRGPYARPRGKTQLRRLTKILTTRAAAACMARALTPLNRLVDALLKVGGAGLEPATSCL